MKRVRAIALAYACVLAGCDGERSDEPTVDETAGAESGNVRALEAGEAAIGAEWREPHGAYLVGTNARAVYLFTADRPGEASTCFDECARAWPPVFTGGEPLATDPTVREELLGTLRRRGGRLQVTYGGWPLYFFVRDRPGDVQGHDMHGYGGEWYLVSPAGERIAGSETERVHGP
ncbi:MAG: hypothetical protein ACOC9O_03175, partial [Myxococcota bacterium]